MAKKSSGWGSRREELSGRAKIQEALRRQDIREQTKALFQSETGKVLLLGEIVLDMLLSWPGRMFLAVLSLVAAWLLL